MKEINVITPGELAFEADDAGSAKAEQLHRDTPPEERGTEPPITFAESWDVPIYWDGTLTAAEHYVVRVLVFRAIKQRWAEIRGREAA